MILWNNISNFQPPKEADNASPCLESVSVQASKDFDHRVPSKLIIPDIFCGSSKPNGHLPHNGSGSTSSSTRSGRSGLSADPHFNERRHSESVVKSRNSQAGAYLMYLFCAVYIVTVESIIVYTHSVVAKSTHSCFWDLLSLQYILESSSSFMSQWRFLE